MITIDMEKARDIHREKMRLVRAPLLTSLDISFQRALEQNGNTVVIVAKKQALRDVTSDPAITAAETIDELKAVWPDILTP
jgi:hypothetical protein